MSPVWLDTDVWGLTAYCRSDQLGPYASMMVVITIAASAIASRVRSS